MFVCVWMFLLVQFDAVTQQCKSVLVATNRTNLTIVTAYINTLLYRKKKWNECSEHFHSQLSDVPAFRCVHRYRMYLHRFQYKQNKFNIQHFSFSWCWYAFGHEAKSSKSQPYRQNCTYLLWVGNANTNARNIPSQTILERNESHIKQKKSSS